MATGMHEDDMAFSANKISLKVRGTETHEQDDLEVISST